MPDFGPIEDEAGATLSCRVGNNLDRRAGNAKLLLDNRQSHSAPLDLITPFKSLKNAENALVEFRIDAGAVVFNREEVAIFSLRYS